MQHNKSTKIGLAMVITTAAAALIAAALRVIMLTGEMSDGLLEPGAVTPLLLLVLLALTLPALALPASRLGRQKTYAAVLESPFGWSKIAGAASLWLLAGSALLLGHEDLKILGKLSAYFGLLAGVCLLAHALMTVRKQSSSFWVMMPVTIWMILRLVANYQTWSRDPVLADYCFSTLADVTTMLAVYHLAGFAMNKGKRRMAAFWACLATGLGALACVDTVLRGKGEILPVASLLVVLGPVLVLLVNGVFRGRKAQGLVVAASGILCAGLLYLLFGDTDVDMAELLTRCGLLMLTTNAMLGLCCSSQADPEPQPEDEKGPVPQTEDRPAQDSSPADAEEASDGEEEASDSADESHEG